jgi:hypothetical protein
VSAQPKAWVCGHSNVEITGSNRTAGMEVGLL